MNLFGNLDFDLKIPPPAPAPGPSGDVPSPAPAPAASPAPSPAPWPGVGQPVAVPSAGVQFRCDATIVGIPAAAEWTQDMSTEQLLIAAGALEVKTEELQLDTAKRNLDSAQAKQTNENKKAAKDNATWIKKAAEAKRKSHSIGALATKWAMFAGSLLATVAAGVATVVTGGLAAPVLALCIAMTIYSATQQINDAAGGDSISIADGLQKGCVMLCEARGMSKEDAEKHGGLIAGFIGGPLAVFDPKVAGMFWGSVAQECGASKATAQMVSKVVTMVAGIAVQFAMMGGGGKGQQLSKLALDVVKVAHGIAGIASFVSSNAMVANAALSIDAAHARNKADNAHAQVKETEAVELKLQDQTGQGLDDFQHLTELLTGVFEWISKALQGLHSNNQQIAGNLVRSA